VIWAIASLVVLVGLVAVLNAVFPGVLSNTDNQMDLTYKILLLILVGSSVVLGYRGRATAAFKHGLAWAGIALILVLAYSFRDDAGQIIDRVTGELMPSAPIMNSVGEVELRASRNGHFHVDAWVDGVKVRFLIDTGATTTALSADDAQRLGFDLAALDYDRVVSTANGQAMVARVRLDGVDVGGIQARDVLATVHREGLDQSLLGMNFLDRLSGFERAGDRLVLRP
jgi:aspartyl protease family protein